MGRFFNKVRHDTLEQERAEIMKAFFYRRQKIIDENISCAVGELAIALAGEEGRTSLSVRIAENPGDHENYDLLIESEQARWNEAYAVVRGIHLAVIEEIYSRSIY